MEIESQDGTRIPLKAGSVTVFGRGNSFNTKDQTVSRRHVLFELEMPVHGTETRTEPRVSFEVLGKNPIWIGSQKNGEIRVLKKLEKGELSSGDRFCVSGQNPVWFSLKSTENGERDVLETESDSNSFDITNIDPVKDFGFLVMGKEFDQYPKHRIRDIKNWDWFLEEPKRNFGDDDDEVVQRGKKGVRRKRRRAEASDDNDWAGESEDEEVVVGSTRVAQRPTYSTRSKDHGKLRKDRIQSKSFTQRKNAEEEDDETEDEDTLGAFIVDNDDVELEGSVLDDDEEEEQDFEDDDDDE